MKAGMVISSALGLLCLGAAAAYFLTIGKSPVASVPAPSAATATAPADAEWKLPPTIAFVPLVQNFSLTHDTAAYVAASQSAPAFYPLKAGTAVTSAARSPDGAWTIVMTADGRAAFLSSADLGPYDPGRAPLGPAPQTISGAAKVIDTATLVVEGQTVLLDGLVGSKDPYAAGLQSAINARGPNVSCNVQQSGRYLCTLPDGQDVGRVTLFNGAANIADDASADYRAQAEAARTGHRGMWK